jgi:sugar phosphate isomerase/epimerase
VPATPPLGLQLYTIREALQADYAAALARVAEIGFRIVEPFDFVNQADDLRAGFAATGLRAESTHLNFLRLDPSEWDAAFETAVSLGIPTVIEPHVDPERWTTVDGIRAIAEELNSAAQVAAKHGIRVGYHNHAFELKNVFDGVTGLEVLAGSLAPEVVLELDTYWAAAGGQDVVALLGRLGDRVRFLHVKDGPIEEDAASQVAVGSGNMPVWDILAAAPQVEVGVVELDQFAGDMWDAVTDSYAYLTGAGAEGGN